jgi:tetratricopeptide (TPR) repeat protein
MSNWATLLWNKDRNEEAQALFIRLTQQYPRHEKAAEAWYAIGRIWQDRKDETRAAAAYDRLATLFAGSQLAREGRWRQGWMAYQNADFPRAAHIFAALAQSASNTAEGESAHYWQARAYERLSDTAKRQDNSANRCAAIQTGTTRCSSRNACTSRQHHSSSARNAQASSIPPLV